MAFMLFDLLLHLLAFTLGLGLFISLLFELTCGHQLLRHVPFTHALQIFITGLQLILSAEVVFATVRVRIGFQKTCTCIVHCFQIHGQTTCRLQGGVVGLPFNVLDVPVYVSRSIAPRNLLSDDVLNVVIDFGLVGVIHVMIMLFTLCFGG